MAAGRAATSTAGGAAAGITGAGQGRSDPRRRGSAGNTGGKDPFSLTLAFRTIGRFTALTEGTHLFKLIFTAIANVFVYWHKTPLCS